MQKLISFTIMAEKGFFKKPDINDFFYLTYNMIHKPAILGILGAIIGLDGYKENEVFPEYYIKLKNIPVGIKPIGDEKGNFQKSIIYYTNTTGHANEGEKKKGQKEPGATLQISEQTLIKPCYKIFLLLDIKDENQKILYENIKNQKAEYLPYLGKNDYSLWWDKDEVKEYKWEKRENHETSYLLSSIFIKENFALKNMKEDSDKDFNLFDFTTNDEEAKFAYFENLPVGFDENLFQYKYENIVYTNFKLDETVSLKNVFKVGDDEYVQLN
jgi:CRISPR-associated protein Cas5h